MIMAGLAMMRVRSRRGRQCATTGQSDPADRAPRQQRPNDQVAEGRWRCPCLERSLPTPDRSLHARCRLSHRQL